MYIACHDRVVLHFCDRALHQLSRLKYDVAVASGGVVASIGTTNPCWAEIVRGVLDAEILCSLLGYGFPCGGLRQAFGSNVQLYPTFSYFIRRAGSVVCICNDCSQDCAEANLAMRIKDFVANADAKVSRSQVDMKLFSRIDAQVESDARVSIDKPGMQPIVAAMCCASACLRSAVSIVTNIGRVVCKCMVGFRIGCRMCNARAMQRWS